MQILVASCDRRRPIWPVWVACLRKFWPDCPFSWRFLSNHIDEPAYNTLRVGSDEGWCLGLINALDQTSDESIMLCLDDDFIAVQPPGESWTQNIALASGILANFKDVGAVGCSPGPDPELPWPHWERLGEVDRTHHPFKRTTLSSVRIWRKALLREVLQHVRAEIGVGKGWIEPCTDRGWQGAAEFEMTGTRVTMDNQRYPLRFLGTRRKFRGLIETWGGISLRGGRFQRHPAEWEMLNRLIDVAALPGIQPFI